ncbi:hypothetical protein V6N13_106897 [Hibiscus sabdariffa]
MKNERWCSYDPGSEKEPLVPPLGHHKSNEGQGLICGCSVNLTILGYCGPDRDRGCSVNLPGSGKSGSDRDSGCSVNLWAGKFVKSWTIKLGSNASHLAMWCSYNTSPEIKSLEPPLGYKNSVDGAGLSCGNSHGTSLEFEPLEPPLGHRLTGTVGGCNVDLPGSGNCGSDQDRGCNVDLSRSSKYGFYRDSFLLIGPLLDEIRLLKRKVDGIRRRLRMVGCIDVEKVKDAVGFSCYGKKELMLISYLSQSHILMWKSKLIQSKPGLRACMTIVIVQGSTWIGNLLISCKGNLNCCGY